MSKASSEGTLLGSLPNQLTTARLGLSFVLFGVIWAQQWLASLIVFSLAAITDWLDGYFARRQKLVTSFGRAYDPLVDKVLVCGTFVFLMAEPEAGLAAWMVTIVVAREFIVTGLRGYLEEKGVSFGADQLGKLKMVLQCAAIVWILVMFEWFPQSETTDNTTPWLVRDILNHAAVLATIASGVNYLRRAWPYL